MMMEAMRVYTTKALLTASGLIAAGIALAILFAPGHFYASYGIDVAGNTNLANELKAPMGILLAAGLFMFVGVVKARFVVPSLAVAALIYLSYGLSRFASMAIDGVPHSGLVAAAAIELVIGALCLAELMFLRRPVLV